MLQNQVVPVNFGGGIDSKTDPKAVIPGKFLRLENGVFTNPNRIAKRNGYTAITSTFAGGGSLTAPSLAHSYNNELLVADQNLLLSYSPSENNWVSRGAYISTEVSRTNINQTTSSSGYVDCAVLGNYALYAWSTAATQNAVEGNFNSSTYASVVDIQTGTIVCPATLLSVNSTNKPNIVRCVTLGSSALAVLYLDSTAGSIKLRVVTFGSSVSFGSEKPVSTNFGGTTFDVVNTSTGASLCYLTQNAGPITGVTIANIDTSGNISASTLCSDASAQDPVHISNNGGNLWLYWVSISGGHPNSIKYSIYSSVLTPILVPTTITTLSSPYAVSNLVSSNVDASDQYIYWGEYSSFSSSRNTDVSFVAQLSQGGGVGIKTNFALGVLPYSRSISITKNGLTNSYAVFVYRGVRVATSASTPAQDQPTYFLVKLGALPSTNVPVVAARFGAGLANTQALMSPSTGTFGNNAVMYTPNISAINSTKVIFACGIQIQEFNSDYFTQQAASLGGFVGSTSYAFNFNSSNAYRAVNAGELAILNGGLLQAYDGQTCAEFGFNLFPEILGLSQVNAAGGAIANGTYSYLTIFQWIDAQGNLHQSAPSLPVSVTTSGVNNAVTITYSLPFLTQKSGVSIAIYRTTGAGGTTGSVYYLVTDPEFLQYQQTSGSSAYFQFTDKLSDAQISGNPQAYTYPASSILENTAPPPSTVMVAHNNRLWFVDAENPNTIYYTKSSQDQVGLSPSGFLLEQIDPKYGNISALAELDDKLVIFKEKGIFVQSGDGANDAGSGSALSFPQFVPSDVGCSELKSVITTPKGVMFKSVNGIYILDRALNTAYLGAEVEAYNSQTITGATLVPGKSQIRFLCSSGKTLVYDYIFNQWSTFTNHTGVSSTTWNNTYVYTNGTNVLQESAGTYTDNGTAFSLLAQTSWLSFASIQGFQRLRRLIMLGDYTNGNSASHALSIQAAYDFSSTFNTAISYLFGNASSSGVFQYRERLPQQKCDAISLLIQETTTGSALEYIDLTNISFEAGVKRGVNKLSGLQSVG